jgi:hypothetical protein
MPRCDFLKTDIGIVSGSIGSTAVTPCMGTDATRNEMSWNCYDRLISHPPAHPHQEAEARDAAARCLLA